MREVVQGGRSIDGQRRRWWVRTRRRASADTRVSRRCKGLPGWQLGTRGGARDGASRGACAPYGEIAEIAEIADTDTVQVEVSWRVVHEQLDEQWHRPCREQRRTMRRVTCQLTHARSGDANDAHVLTRLKESNERRDGPYDPNHVALRMRRVGEPSEPIDETRHD